MTSKKEQLLKPATVAKKLSIYLPAAPEKVQTEPLSRTGLAELVENPPAWLEELHRNGPHPRGVVAGKLGVSISGLARAGVDEALTTAEIKALLVDPPAWLVEERAIQAGVRAEKERIKAAAKPKAKPELR